MAFDIKKSTIRDTQLSPIQKQNARRKGGKGHCTFVGKTELRVRDKDITALPIH